MEPSSQTGKSSQRGGTLIGPKYEITETVHPFYPWLHRIRALRDIRKGARAGAWGGFIQSENNLSQEGDCWVFDNSIVAENAMVSENAIVRNGSFVCGSAVISGKAEINSLSIVRDRATVIDAYVTGGSYVAGDGKLLPNDFTHEAPILWGQDSVYGELNGKIYVDNGVVILPGKAVANPTLDLLWFYPKGIQIHREFREKSRGKGRVFSPYHKPISQAKERSSLER